VRVRVAKDELVKVQTLLFAHVLVGFVFLVALAFVVLVRVFFGGRLVVEIVLDAFVVGFVFFVLVFVVVARGVFFWLVFFYGK
jgi:hypothetical protein